MPSHSCLYCIIMLYAFFSAQLTLGAISFKSLYRQEANVTIWNWPNIQVQNHFDFLSVKQNCVLEKTNQVKDLAFMSCQNKLSKQIKRRTLLHSSKIYTAHLIPKLIRLNTAKPIIGFWSFCIYFSHSHNRHIVHIHYIHVLRNWLKRLISFICSTLNNATKQVITNHCQLDFRHALYWEGSMQIRSEGLFSFYWTSEKAGGAV